MTLSVAFFMIVLDRLTKILAVKNMSEGQSIKIVPDIFHLTLVFNKGMAFGLLKGQRMVFIVFSILVIAFIIFYIFKRKTTGIAISAALGLILGGAAGNLADRLIFGHVIDFFDFRVWPVFNIADSGITLGTVLLLLSVIFKKNKKY